MSGAATLILELAKSTAAQQHALKLFDARNAKCAKDGCECHAEYFPLIQLDTAEAEIGFRYAAPILFVCRRHVWEVPLAMLIDQIRSSLVSDIVSTALGVSEEDWRNASLHWKAIYPYMNFSEN